MRKILFIISLWLIPSLLFSQQIKTVVISSGGGMVGSSIYNNFGVLGQTFATGSANSRYQNREGFIFAQQNQMIISIDSAQTICPGASPQPLKGTVSRTEGVPLFQWQKLNNTTWEPISGATNASFDPGVLVETTHFRLVANDRQGAGPVPSDSLTITVKEAFDAGAIEITGETLCNTGDPVEILNTIAASGGDNVISYQWQSSTTSLSTGYADISGATNLNFKPGTLNLTTWYRRMAKDSTCVTTLTPSTGVWKVIISPASVGGTVSGGTGVCYGTNNTLLTLDGHTGTVVKWQYSTDNTNWTDINGHTPTTYSAVNLTANTWYRAVVASIPCSEAFSDATQITILTGFTLNGYAKYENNPRSPLNGLKITLKKDGSPVGTPVVTGANGYYSFSGLDQGNYSLDISSSHPSGQWQTWGGVNNTDYLLVSKHIAGTQYLPANPPVVQTTASVKVPHPLINTLDANTIRQAAKFPTTGYTYFDIPKWVFSGMDASSGLDDIELVCADVTRDIRGLCAGDVNGTYVPAAGYKTAVETLHATSLQLEHLGTLPLSDEMIFPIRVDRDMELGAMTLYLDFDPSVMIVTGVTIPENSGAELWFKVNSLMFNVEDPTLNLKPETLNLKPSTLNTLAIGWMSLEPMKVAEGQAVILIHARLRGAVKTLHATSLPLAHPIRFTLNENPLSEFADGDGNVIEGLKLSMPTAGNSEIAKGRNSEIFVYPNPAQSTLNLELETFNPEPETLTLELVNLQGVAVISHPTAAIGAGQHKYLLDLRDILPGVYFLRIKLNGEVLLRKVYVVK